MRKVLFSGALRDVEAELLRNPRDQILPSIRNQLRYLIELDDGRSQDRSRLKEVIVGIQAVRESDRWDPSLTDLLFEVAAEARRMKECPPT